MTHSTPEYSNASVRELSSSRTTSGFDVHDQAGSSIGAHADQIIIPDAALLFSGDYKRSGPDLIISGPSHNFTIANYFRGEHHRPLFSEDGASLSGDVVDALTGQTIYAQAGPGADTTKPIGHVVKLSGNASAIRNGVSVSLNIGDNVFKGDVVQCGANSALGMSFIDGTAFSLASNARMVLNEMVYDPTGSSNSSLLSLVQGTISFVAGETAKHGNMKVDTPVATMGIRGTAVLVEISADNGPTKFSVLVEPGQVTGSFVLLDRYTGATLGSISQAGLMTLVTPAGQNQLTISEQLKTQADLQAEKDIVQLVFSIAFPNFNLNDTKPHSTGSIGSGVTPFETLGFYPFGSVFLSEFTKLAAVTTTTAASSNGPEDIFLRRQAEVAVANVSTFQAGGVADTQSSIPGTKTFAIASQVTIFDPIASDVTVPFLPGSARIVGATGPASIPAGFNLLSLVSVDPTTGVVTYDPSNFRFLGANETAQYVIAFESQVGNSIVPETLLFTVNGLDDAPVFSAANVQISLSEIPGKTGSSDPITQSALLNFQDLDFSDTGSGYSATVLHTAVTGVTAGLPHDPAALDAILRSYLTPSVIKNIGSTDGALTETFSAPGKAFDYLAAGEKVSLIYTIEIKDAAGATSTETLTVTITGVNDLPQIIGEINPAPVVVQASHPTIREVLPLGTSTNSLGLPTETFDAQTAGSASNNGAGFGNFFSAALNASFSGSGNAGVVNGSSDTSVVPNFDPSGTPNTTNYLSIGNGTETITFNQLQNAFGLYWGSIDPFNTITFFDGAILVASYNGADLTPQGSFYVQFSNLSPYDKVVLQSPQAFEIENISAGFVLPVSEQHLEPLHGTLTATDADIGDTLTASVTGPATIELNGSTALPANVDVSSLLAASAISFDSVTSNGGPVTLNWIYNPGTFLDFLKPGDTLTITYTAEVNDGTGSVGSQPLTITILGDSGVLSIANGAALELGDFVGSTEAVTFQGSTGMLALDNASHFTGTISGFTGNGTLAGSDQIDLKNINFNSASFSESFDSSTGTLSVNDGTNSASLHFNGSYSPANFSFVSDGNGGTIVYDPPASSPAATTIIATVPNETLTGDGNGNVFVFNFSGFGDDMVRNFHPETDTLRLSSSLFASVQAILDATHDDGHGNAVITVDAHDTITLAGILKANLSALDFHFA